MSPKWIAGLIMFFLICTFISNIIEKQDAFTEAQVSAIREMRGQTIAEVKDPSIGGAATGGMNPLSVVNAIWTALTLKYSFLYEVDYTINSTQCAALTSAEWNSTISACQRPNLWWPLWLILIYGPIVAIAFFLILEIGRLIRGA